MFFIPCNNWKRSHKKRIVWKHGPNWPFYALMLRTKLYENPFFFTGDQNVHQNVNKPKSRAVRTVYQPIFLPFYKIIVRFCEDANKARSNCDIMGCNFSKKHKLTLYKTLNGEPNYVNHKFFFNFC